MSLFGRLRRNPPQPKLIDAVDFLYGASEVIIEHEGKRYNVNLFIVGIDGWQTCYLEDCKRASRHMIGPLLSTRP